jgi:hypothetical protein
LKYQKYREDKEVSNTIRFLDKHGNEIPACIELDTETGYATVYELADPNNPRSTVILRQKPFPQAKVIIDNVVNPDDTQLQNIREKKKGRRE